MSDLNFIVIIQAIPMKSWFYIELANVVTEFVQ
jgi:hypothetical protein